jgi:hypothetical protein
MPNPKDSRGKSLPKGKALEQNGGVNFREKIIAWDKLAEWRAAMRASGRNAVVICANGGDYTLETLNQEERWTVEQAGGKVVNLPIVPGKSTTEQLRQIARL